MEISQQIESVYRRALLLRQHILASPVQETLVEKALQELYFVLEELQTSQEELSQQNQLLLATRQAIELEGQRYQALFNLAPTGYVVTDRQGYIQQANRYAATQLLGAPQEYLVNKPLIVFIHESDRPYFQARLAHLRPEQTWEVRLNPRQQELIAAVVTVTLSQDPQSRQDILLWSFHDITQRKLLEHQLQAAHDSLEQQVAERTAELVQANVQLQQEIADRQHAEQKNREQAALIDIATDAIFVQDLDHHISFWSQGAERLYGWRAADILGQSTTQLLPPAAIAPDGMAHRVGFTATLAQGAWQGEFDHVTQSGQAIVVASRWTLVRDKTGQPQSILVVNSDITAQKQLELQFYRAQRIDSLGTLASGMAHDLTNAFAPILFMAQSYLNHPQTLDERTYKAWQMVDRNAQRGADLVRQITMFARGTSGQRVPLPAEQLLTDITPTLQKTFPAAITIHTDLPPAPLAFISGDPTQLYQVVMNLCVNARDAMPTGGTLTLAIAACHLATPAPPLTVPAGDYVMITVSDTGIGMPPNVKAHLFEPFFTTKALGQGTGLGLASVFRIVKDHGGAIDFSSEVGQGTQFRVYFPQLR